MSDFLHKVLDFIVKILNKIKTYLLETKDLLGSEHKEITLVGLVIIALQTLLLCCFVSSPNTAKSSEPTYSNTEIASTIMAGYIEQTKQAPKPTTIPNTPTPELTPTPNPTIDPIEKIYTDYPCIPRNDENIYGQVVEVIDGDTVKVRIGLETYSVRYIGIDCPECKDPRKPIEIFSQEAFDKNKIFVEGKEVLLIKDVSEVDKYDRLLRYVFVDTTFVNYELVKQGFAHASTYPPDVACSEFFASAQNKANVSGLGFWSNSFLPATETPVLTENTSAECDPCYPGVCIPKVSYDLNCKDISIRRFQCDCDPHGFDGDNDGVGCESG